MVCLLQEARPFLLKAHKSLLRSTELLEVVSNLRDDFDNSASSPGTTQSLVELGRVWQAPLYEITLNSQSHDNASQDGGRFCYSKFFSLDSFFFLDKS